MFSRRRCHSSTIPGGLSGAHVSPVHRWKRAAAGALCWVAAVWFAAPAAGETVQDVVGQISQLQYQAYLGYPGDLTDANNPLPADRRNPLCTHSGDNRNNSQADWTTARNNMVHFFDGFGLTTTVENTPSYYNVVARQTGLTAPNEIYIIGAHYDSVGNPGADDNASGVAGVLEIARVLSQYRFAATITFVAFDREEDGLLGSKAYAGDANARDDDIRGMISLDMIAYNRAGASHDRAYLYGRTDPIRNALGGALTSYGGLSYTIQGHVDLSDHAPFEWNGYPACLLIEAGVWDNPNYHGPNDNVDVPGYIDYAYATNMTRGVAGWLAEQAGLIPWVTDWNQPAGDWSDANGWTSGEPTELTRASICNGGTVTVTTAGQACASLTVGGSAGQTGTVNMTAGGLAVGGGVRIYPAAAFNLGAAALAHADPNLDVDIENDGLLEVTAGSHTLGQVLSIDPNVLGTTQIDANASLSVSEIVQDTVTIGAGATLTIRGSNDTIGLMDGLLIDGDDFQLYVESLNSQPGVLGPAAGETPIPEPTSTAVLVLGLALLKRRSRRRRATLRASRATPTYVATKQGRGR